MNMCTKYIVLKCEKFAIIDAMREKLMLEHQCGLS